MNPYQVLNIQPTDDLRAIRRAYVRETKKHHPDRGGDSEHFRTIQAAYTDLKQIHKIQAARVHSADVRFSLHDLLMGCTATVLLQINQQTVAVEFVVPPLSFPGTFVEFQDKLSTPQRIRVRLLEIPTKDYTRVESDVVIQRQINSSDAQAGITVEVKNFDGNSHKVKVSPDTTAASLRYCISGEGFFNRSTKARGDLHIIINVQG